MIMTRLSSLSDAQILTQSQNDKKAFAVLYERYVKKIYNFFYYRTFKQADSEDLTSQTFEKALVKIESLYPDSNFKAWIFTVARNILIDYYRKQKEEVDIENVNLNYEPNFLEQLHEKEKITAVIDGLRQCNELEQEVLLLKYQQDLTSAEIGEVCGKSEGAVKQIIHRAIEKIRTKYRFKL